MTICQVNEKSEEKEIDSQAYITDIQTYKWSTPLFLIQLIIFLINADCFAAMKCLLIQLLNSLQLNWDADQREGSQN